MPLPKSYGIAKGWALAPGQVGATVAPPALLPVATAPPVVSGAPVAGSTLTASDAVWSNGPILSRVRQWYASDAVDGDWIAIEGAGAAEYEATGDDTADYLRVGEIASNAAGAGDEVFSAAVGPVSASADAPAGVLAKSWGPDVWALAGDGAVGPQYEPTTPATDTGLYPAGATLGGVDSRTITLGGAGGVFEGFILNGQTISVSAPGWTIRNNRLKGFRDWRQNSTTLIWGWVNSSYDLVTDQSDTVICFNDFDGDFGRASKTAISINGAAARVKVYGNDIHGSQSDPLKVQSTITDLDERPELWGNHIRVGAWAEVAGPHFDAITVGNGGAYAHDNLWDLTSYINPDGTQEQTEPLCINTPPAGTPAGLFTWGLTNVLRVQGGDGSVIDNVTFTRNIAYGHRRGGPYPFQVSIPEAAETIAFGAIDLSDNVLEQGYKGAMFHPNNAPDATISFGDNVRISDAAAFTSMWGDTAVVPDAPVIGGFKNVSLGGATIRMDRAPGASEADHQYAVSSAGPSSGFSAWAALPTNHAIAGLDNETQYWVKVRGFNAHGNGAESNVASFITLEGAASLFVAADNGGAAWSQVLAPLAGQPDVKRIAIFIDCQVDVPAGGKQFLDSATGSVTFVGMTTAAQLRLQIQGSSVTRATVNYAPPAGRSFRQVWTVDYTVIGTEAGGAIGDGVKLTIDGEQFPITISTHNTLGQTRALVPATFLANLNIMGNTSVGNAILDGRVKAVAILVGDETLTLPDISTKEAFDALFDDEHVEATLAGWQFFYGTSAPGDVGNSDGSNANTWNATGGLSNRGTLASKPLIKKAGAYA